MLCTIELPGLVLIISLPGSAHLLVLHHGRSKISCVDHLSEALVQNGVSGIFGGFVAYVRLQLLPHRMQTHIFTQGISFDTNAKIAPYKIMYLLTGGLAFVAGIIVTIWMPDSPVHALFLTPKERVIAVERIRDDQGGTENKIIKRHQVIEAFSDVKSWLIVLLTLMSEL